MPEENKRVAMKFSRQYSSSSVRGKQYQALKEYYEADELKRLIEQIIWAILGPTGSALMGSSLDEVERQLIRSKDLIAVLNYSALELAGGGSPQESMPQGSVDVPTTMPNLEELSEDTGELGGDDINDIF